MGAVISDVDIAHLHSLYPYAGIDAGFSAQQEQFILQFMKGMTPAAAARAVGMSPARGQEMLRQERVVRVIELLREREFADVRITRDMLNGLLIEAHSKAANATEEINAVKELGKMNGLYESDKQKGALVQVNVGSQVKNVKQLEKMDEAQLLELAEQDMTLDVDDYEVKKIEGADGRSS